MEWELNEKVFVDGLHAVGCNCRRSPEQRSILGEPEFTSYWREDSGECDELCGDYGEIVSVSDTSITVQAGAGAQTIQRQDVRRVRLMKNKHRLRNTLVVAGIGAGAGRYRSPVRS